MSRTQRIQQLLSENLFPDVLIVENESHNHRVREGAETHFKIIAVSAIFQDKTRLERHRLIHTLLETELQTGLHALTLQLHTPKEWENRGGEVNASPPCQHKT